ncbi:MAG: serine/threonine-protein kinase [Myxococcota bacterium]
MTRCRTCGQDWPDSYLNCPDDGTSLHSTEVIDSEPEVTAVAQASVLSASALSARLEPGSRAGDYLIEEVLGEGGMATVYAASHSVIGKKAAVKVMSNRYLFDDSAVTRFVREARAVNEISHPNIVDIFDFGNTPDGRCFLAMERLNGRSLAERLGDGPLPVEHVIAMGLQICDALEAAHARGIIHRDLKPGNVFFVEQAGDPIRVKLLDFGIAKVLDETGDDDSVTQTGQLIGTPAYIAPEQVNSEPATSKSDVYSLGIVLFEALTAQRPFRAQGAMNLLVARVKDDAPRLKTVWPECPRKLDTLIASMLERTPERRIDLDGVRDALRGYSESDDAVVTPALRRSLGTSNRRALAYAGALLVFVCSIAGWALLNRGQVVKAPPPLEEIAQPVVAAVVPDETLAPEGKGEPPTQDGAVVEPSPPTTPPKRARRTDGGRSKPASRVTGFGELTVNARPWVRVRVDGGPVKETPVRQLRLSAGNHSIQFANEDASFRQSRRIRVRRDERIEIFVDVPKGSVNVRRK